MKKILYFLVLISLVFFTGCDPDDSDHHPKNKVLMLKVDYTTYNFEGGIEYCYDHKTDSFTIDVNYVDTSDISSLRLTYKELNKTLFYGTLIWNGMGERITPETLNESDFFETVLTEDVVFPSRGFANLFSLYDSQIEYFNVWMSIQNLLKVRQFLSSNPNQKVQIFVYAPNYYGYSTNWDYYIFIQN